MNAALLLKFAQTTPTITTDSVIYNVTQYFRIYNEKPIFSRTGDRRRIGILGVQKQFGFRLIV